MCLKYFGLPRKSDQNLRRFFSIPPPWTIRRDSAYEDGFRFVIFRTLHWLQILTSNDSPALYLHPLSVFIAQNSHRNDSYKRVPLFPNFFTSFLFLLASAVASFSTLFTDLRFSLLSIARTFFVLSALSRTLRIRLGDTTPLQTLRWAVNAMPFTNWLKQPGHWIGFVGFIRRVHLECVFLKATGLLSWACPEGYYVTP